MGLFDIAKNAIGDALYKKIFSAYEKPDHEITGGLNNYSFVEDRLPRELVKFESRNATLQGYFFKNKGSRKLVVVCHGLHSCADEFLPEVLFFYSKGYNVFSYDLTGVGLSGGEWMFGLIQFAVDLDYCLNFLNTWSQTKTMSKYLFGHSMGGYAVLSNLERHKNIKAVAAVAAPNDASKLLFEKGEQFGGDLVYLGADYVENRQLQLFGDYTKMNAVNGINSVNCPILLAHSPIDMTVDYFSQSAVSHKEEFTNPNVYYYIPKFKQMGHTKILFSKEAIKYQSEIDGEVKEYKNENEDFDSNVIKEMYAKSDRFKYSELNQDLFEYIIQVFDDKAK